MSTVPRVPHEHRDLVRPIGEAQLAKLIKTTYEAEALTSEERTMLAASLECGIKAGKLPAFSAIGIARKLNLPLAAWINEQAKRFVAANAGKF